MSPEAALSRSDRFFWAKLKEDCCEWFPRKVSPLLLERRKLIGATVAFFVTTTVVSTVFSQSTYEPYAISTFAGLAGNPGSADGTGNAARFSNPIGVAVDSLGNAYVADSGNDTIRMITSGGVVSTLAGSAGAAGSADGTGGAARFNGPYGVAVDGVGNIYVADTTNHTIRMITSGGVVTTLAGLAGVSGSNDGTGSAARFYYPSGVAVDSVGNIYVADRSNRTIRMITSGGVVTTLAGLAGVSGSNDGTGSAARFYAPTGAAVDSAGNIYVTDQYNNTIRKITSAGVVSTLAGLAGTVGSADGTGSAARFNQPFGVAVDSTGNVYIADSSNRTIRKITSAGVVTTLAGLAGTVGSADGIGSAARFADPWGLGVTNSGNLYVGDFGNDTIRVGVPAALPAPNFIETFNNAPDYTNNWHVAANSGTPQITYTQGNLQWDASQSVNSNTLSSNLLFTGDIDVTFQFNHQGFGRTNVGLISADEKTYLALAALDTDDTNYLNFIVPPNSTEYEHSGSPYMNRPIAIRIQVQGLQVKFYAGVDGSVPVLLDTLTFSSTPAGGFHLFLNVGSAPWKSGPNTTSFTSVMATGTTVFIDARFDKTILDDSNSPAIQATIKQAMSIYQSLFSNPITVTIFFRYSSVDCEGNPLDAKAKSTPSLYTATFDAYSSALESRQQETGNDTTALASLLISPPSNDIRLSTANAKALYLRNVSSGIQCGPVYDGNTYDGVITLNSAAPLQFTRPPASCDYDALSIVEHEIDEVLGWFSSLNLDETDVLTPLDLFSWSGKKTRNTSSNGQRYFSIDGGGTNIAEFNQDRSQGDLGDWLSAQCSGTSYVQDARRCAGQYPDVSATSPEGIALDVIGYDLVTSGPSPSPTPIPGPNVQVTVQTNPVGLAFTVDEYTYSTPQTFSWPVGSCHPIVAASPQSGGAGVRYVWSNWSDSGKISHTVSPTKNTTYTAKFTTQYLLTMSAGTGGKVSPASGWKNSGSTVSLTATPTNTSLVSYSFNGWTGSGNASYSGTNNPASIIMSGPITESASFVQNPVNVTVQTNNAGPSFSVDGTTYTSAQTFSWQPGSSHTIATTSPQSAGTGVRYAWNSWSDNGTISHTVAPTTNKTYAAKFTKQYFLTMSAGTGGTVTPASGWKNSGAAVSITAKPSTGYSFTSWTGTGTGSFSGTTNPSSITMGGPISEAATFTHN